MLVRVSAESLHLVRWMLTLPRMREMSVAGQRYKAVLAVVADGRTLTEVARDWGVSRQTLHACWREQEGRRQCLTPRL